MRKLFFSDFNPESSGTKALGKIQMEKKKPERLKDSRAY